jgi:hypothetical protein
MRKMIYCNILMTGYLQDTQCLFNEILNSFALDTPLPLPYTSALPPVRVFHKEPH